MLRWVVLSLLWRRGRGGAAGAREPAAATRGVLLFAVGAPLGETDGAPAIGEALRLARTIRRFHASARDLGVCLDYHVVAADDPARGAAEAELRRRAAPLGVELRAVAFDAAPALARAARARGCKWQDGCDERAIAELRLRRMERLAASPFERTLYLDSDALACARLDGFFAALGESDVAYVSTKTLGKSVRKKTGLDAIFNASAAPPGAAPVAESAYLNAGVLAFRNSTGARRLLAAWRRVFVDEYLPRRVPGEHSMQDQPALWWAARTTPGVALERLPDEYHCKTHTTGATCARPGPLDVADLSLIHISEPTRPY